MPRHEPYLILLDPTDPRRSFAYCQARDGILVSVMGVEPGGLETLGPWPRDIADQHARERRAAGYLAYIPSQDLASMQTARGHASSLGNPAGQEATHDGSRRRE